MHRSEIIAISNRIADEYAIPRLLLLACGAAESDLSNARRPADPADDERYWRPPDPFDVSAGVWQQTVRWDPDYRGGDDWPGHEEIERVLALQMDVERSARVAARQLRAHYRPGEADGLFRTLCRYNWPAGGGAPYTADHETNYRNGLAEAAQLLHDGVGSSADGVDHGSRYNAAEPVEQQDENWECSCASAAWAARSVGVPTTSNEVQRWLGVLEYGDPNPRVSTNVGLLRATGEGLVAMFRERGLRADHAYGGWGADWFTGVSFDDVAARAGGWPIMIGMRRWCHWSGVRGYDAARDVLLLANSAHTYMGIGQEMDRGEFERLGPTAMVWVEAEGGEDMARVAELERQVHSLSTALAHVCDVVVGEVLARDGLSAEERLAAVTSAKSIRVEFLGAKVEEEDPVKIAELEAKVANLEGKVHGLTTALAHVCDVVVTESLSKEEVSREERLAVVAAAQAVRKEFLG